MPTIVRATHLRNQATGTGINPGNLLNLFVKGYVDTVIARMGQENSRAAKR
ncbi:hypothetical protein [Kitasatospora sp. NPDC088783]|uniref:hypothetical protein n=1 Tax=Kitasatospora sp. NPDC088783 TaxID=3364077 RepID=UPI003814A717